MLEAAFHLALEQQPQVLSVSEGVEALLGYKPEDFLTSKVSLPGRIHPNDSDIAEPLFSPSLYAECGIFNIRIRHADGQIRCIRGRGAKKVDPDGAVQLHLTLQDAKSLKVERADLHASLSLKSVMESVDECVYFKDRNHVLTEANLNARMAFSGSAGQPPDLVGLTDYDLLAEPDADASYELEKQIFDGMPLAHEVKEFAGKDGKKTWTDIRKYPVKDSGGEIIGLFGIARDITDSVLADKALRESRELLQLFVRHAPVALAMFDRDMRYLAASRRWLEDYSLEGREVIGQSHYEILPEIPEHWRDVHRRAQAGETIQNQEERLSKADGSIQWVRRELRPWLTAGGAIGGIIIFAEDVTLRKQAENRLHFAASIFNHASEGIMVTDARGTILEVNESFTRITGYTRDEVVGRNPRILNSGRQSKEFYERMWRDLVEKGKWSGEIWNRAKNGRVYAEMLTISALRDASGNPQQYVALFSDATLIKEQEQILEHVTNYDQLTGLPNRALLGQRLQQAIAAAGRKGRSLAVACLDLDDFRAVNERLGHEAGNRLLSAVARRMKLALRADDTLARLGGDGFAVVLSDLDQHGDGEQALTRLMKSASEPIQLEDLVVQLSASAGVAFFPQADDVDADQLLRQSDQAMYQAKLEGKNRYHIFDPRLDRTVRGHHEDLERIRLALEAKEFVLYYQPKVNMCTGKVLGAEALIRWQHPQLGLLLPGVFLPVLEEHPLAIELGEWVIDTALVQMERWRAGGLDIPVSVNVGAQQLQQENFVDRLSALLAAHPAVLPSSLELEVLESSALQDVAKVAQVIAACDRMGVSFALDDFGTGYSTLTYLRRLPARVLKIDQSFVRDMLEDPEDLTILEGVLGLATAFRRQVVAEGVESLEHGLMLLRMGCPAAQGYGIARPMPADDLPSWTEGWRPPAQWAGVTPFDAADRPLLYAAVEHRAWIVGIEAFLEGRRHTPPAWAARQCQFGLWLRGGGLTVHGGLLGLQRIEALHRSIHAFAAEILALDAQGQKQEAIGRIPALVTLRDSLFDKLNDLIREI
jgi:diguanylate cyclase (GGDEF)-like protein/PAS domain S-box-containing protein